MKRILPIFPAALLPAGCAAPAEEITYRRVNMDENPEPAIRFGIMSIPALVVMENGKIVNQATGARPKNAILAML